MNLQNGGLIFVALTVLASGCLHAQEEPETPSPDPEVVDSSLSDGVLQDLLGQEAELTIVVQNRGDAGPVQVTATIYNDQGTVLDRYTETVDMDEGERRQLVIGIQVPENANRYGVTARPANDTDQ